MATADQLRKVGLREAWIAGTEDDVNAYLRSQITTINKAIKSGSVQNYSRRQLESMLRVLKSSLNNNLVKFTKEFQDTAVQLSFLDVDSEVKMISDVSGTVAVTPTVSAIEKATENVKFTDFAKQETLTSRQLVAKLGKSNIKSIDAIIKDGYVNGSSNAEILGELVGTRVVPATGSPYYTGGYVPTAHKRDVMTTVRTVTQSISQNAREEVWRENKDVIGKIEYVATLDNRTTMICASYDGTLWDINDPTAPIPPLHWGCRSTRIPVIGGDDPLDYRVAKDGKSDVTQRQQSSSKTSAKKKRTQRAEVPAGTNYDEFLRGQYTGGTPQPEWFLNDMLGKTRADIYRENPKVTIRSLMKKDNTPFSIKELEKKYKRAG